MRIRRSCSEEVEWTGYTSLDGVWAYTCSCEKQQSVLLSTVNDTPPLKQLKLDPAPIETP